MRSGVAAAGNWIVDRVKIIDRWPEQDALANILDEQVGNGGGAFNVLTNLSRLGAQFPLEGIGLVGNDQDSNWVLERCRENGVGTDRLKAVDAPTSHTDVMTVRETGRRTFFHQRGANALFSREHVQLEKLDSKIFYLGYLLLLDALDLPDREFGTQAARLLADASRNGLKTAIDVVSEDSDRFPRIVQPALPHVDWCFMNEFEAERTTGTPIRRDDELDRGAMERAAIRILELGVHEAVFLHAPEGAMAVAAAGDRIWHAAITMREGSIVGCVGAGDAFAAGALYGLHEGQPLAVCLKMGVCVAAASLTRASASEGILSLEECLKLAQKSPDG